MCRGAVCLSCVGTYLAGTILQGCRLLKQCRNLPARHCVAEVQAALVVFEPACLVLCCRGAVCLSSFGSYLPSTVLQGRRLFKRCQNLPAGHCVLGGQSV